MICRRKVLVVLLLTFCVGAKGCYVYPEGKTDPCQNKTCHFYGRCIPSDNGKSWQCVCPQYCYDYGDNVDNKPVCGSNNVEYPNICSFQKAACENQRNMTYTYGKCDLCKDLPCTPPQVCVIDPSTQRPTCGCVQSCEDRMEQVCGTDGNLYSNRCKLDLHACHSGRNIKVQNEGPCQEGPCASKTCYYGSCRIDNRNQAVCDCEPECPSIGTASVCGTDGVTYDSECHLRKASCEQGLFIIKEREGACDGLPQSCRTKQCAPNERCVEENGIPQCIRNPCKDCQGERFNPVCGSNDMSYDNLCELEKANCTSGQTAIKLQMYGFCAEDGCGKTKGDCEYYGVCDRSRPNHQCVCPTDCRRTNIRICGSDSVTYSDECEMKIKSCQERRTISVTSVGECVTCKEPCLFYSTCSYGRCECDAVCPSGGPPVCTSDGQRFNNDCERKKNVCEKKLDLTVVPCEQIGCSSDYDCTHHGRCRSGVCSCDFYCPAENRKVCTSNGKEFDSECEVKKHMCETKEWIPFTTGECLREVNCDCYKAGSRQMTCDPKKQGM